MFVFGDISTHLEACETEKKQLRSATYAETFGTPSMSEHVEFVQQIDEQSCYCNSRKNMLIQSLYNCNCSSATLLITGMIQQELS
jgi:hypothetical protein